MLPSIEVPRLARCSDCFEFWLFAGARSYAYGVAVYIANYTSNHKLLDINLLMSRSHIVARAKTIPQLELIAALYSKSTAANKGKSFPDRTTNTLNVSARLWHLNIIFVMCTKLGLVTAESESLNILTKSLTTCVLSERISHRGSGCSKLLHLLTISNGHFFFGWDGHFLRLKETLI